MTIKAARLRVLHAFRASILALAASVLAVDLAPAAEPEAAPRPSLDARERALAELDFRTGLSAYGAADYERAFAHWLAWSLKGDANAQTALGFLYLKGLGVRQDLLAAAHWYERAAQQGVPIAQYFLGSLLFRGEGIQRDFVNAHMWCDLALSAGFTAALACRETVANKLTVAELQEARRRVVEWRKTRQR